MSEKSEQYKNADAIIRNHMMWAMGAGLIPVPIADFFAVSAIQLDMIRQMCKLYEVDFKETEVKAIVTSLTSSGLARLGARAAVKFIPGVGSVLGGITMSVLSGGSTYALGEVFKQHFDTGGTFLDFDLDRLKKFYDEKFEKGKKVAQKMKQDREEKEKKMEDLKNNDPEASVLEKVKELAELRKEGLITAEEYERMKKKLID